MVPLTVEDRLLIKALPVEKGWRCGSNDCRISCQTMESTHVFTHERTYEQPFLVTMSTSTNKRRYKNNLLGLLLLPPWRNIARNQQFYRHNSPISYLHRQFNDRYINSFIIVFILGDTFFKVELPFKQFFWFHLLQK